MDLSIEITTLSAGFSLTARNQGTADAYGVTVDFELADQILAPDEVVRFKQKSGTTCSGNIPGTTCIYGVWTVGDLKAGEEVISDGIDTKLASGLPCCPGLSQRRSVPARAVIKNTVPREEERFKGDNTTVNWSHMNQSGSGTIAALAQYWLEASVDDLLPDAGDTVKFKIDMGSNFGSRKFIHDAKVRLRLDNGMGTPTATPFSGTDTFGAVRGLERTWDWVLDTIADGSIMELSTTLDNPLPAGVARSDLCLTAELTARPDSTSSRSTTAKVCLLEDPITLFETGEADLLGLHSCVGVTTYPCSSTDTLEFVVHGREAAEAAGVLGKASDKIIMAPEKVVIQVKDPDGRGQASNSAVWRSGSNETDSGAAGIIPGVVASLDFPSDFNQNTFSITDSTTGGKPGTVRIISTADTSIVVLNIDTQTSFGPIDLSGQIPIFWEFGELGTYKMAITLGATHASSSTKYSDTSTLTFHVGPIAELEVKDGGASPHVAADRSALTIVVSNNGPDDSPGARVTGLPTGAEVIHSSQGRYEPSTGVWHVGEIKEPGLLRAAGLRNPTLVLAAAAGDTARVTIEYSVDYEVCIDSSGNDVDLSSPSRTACTAEDSTNTWHTTPVYDYKAANSAAIITAARGTGGVGPGIPSNPRTTTGITAVTWDPVQYLYGRPVVRYGVQRLDGSSWSTLDDGVTGNVYADTAPGAGRDYRVRAVNVLGAFGPWSRSTAVAQAGLAGPPVNLRTQADGNNAIDVSWDAPEDTGGSAVTGYTVQWSADGTGGWSNAGSTADQTFKHRGLQTGDVRYYRVAARNRSGLGLWSDPVMGQTTSGVPAAPTLNARSLSDYEIELTWNEPKDNGDPITGYRIEWSSDGSANSWNGLADVSADPTSYVDSSLLANERRQYRVRAVNGVGNGDWSRSVSAITQLSPPSAPNLTSAEADGPNAIVVTWEEPSFLGDLPVTQYQVQWAKDPDSQIWRGPQSLSGSTLSWRHTGLKPDETWYYQVRASNGGGRWSPWSYILAATTASDNAPKAVSGLGVQYDSESDQVNVTWNEQTGGDTAFSYDLERSEDGSDWRDLATVSTCDAGKCAYADRDIWRGARLYYRVRASIDGDAGPWSGAKSVTVPPNPPDEPFVMWAEANGSDQIYYEWEPPYSDGGAPVTGYRLLWCRVLDGADDNPCDVTPDEDNPLADPPGYSRIALGASVRSYTQSVSAGYVYYYLLRATNGGNRWSEWGYVHSITVYPGLPAAPGLTARAVDANQIRLTWTRPNSYGSEIGEYWLYIYRYGENLYDFSDTIIDILRIPGDQTEYTLGGLDPETTRYFRVRALNDNGEGKYSPLRQATTPGN